ncbi:MAG: SdpI family protein [Candidatus Micrarchaeota archaeon]
MKIKSILAIIIILVGFTVSAFVYNNTPEKMIMRWGFDGEPTAYWTKDFGLFFLPVLSIAIFGLMTIIPSLDPLKKNITKFNKEYQNFVLIVVGFMVYLHIGTIVMNFTNEFQIGQILAPGFALLLYSVGNLLEKAKRNWFIGIRTPWTLSSDRVWKKTHELGATLFRGCGVVSLLGLVLPQASFFIIIVPILIATIVLFVYSYLEFRKN